MNVCVVGAGAIGGLVGVKMALAGADVTLIAKGPHLEAIRKNGLRLIGPDGAEQVVRFPKATADMTEVGRFDLVVLGLKSQQIAPVASSLAGLIGPETVVLPLQNGLPWWYFHKHGGPHGGRRLESCDPSGELGRAIDLERVVGCVTYPGSEVTAPGVIRHVEGDRFPMGELDGAETGRIRAVSQAFVQAGLKAPILADIRSEIWLKLWGNLSFNPISALTHATLSDICQYPLTRDLVTHMMVEAQQIAHKLGIVFRVPLEKRIAGAERVGKHKTSTLQDVERGRAMELDALMGTVIELGRITQTATPYLDTVYALTKLLGKTLTEENGRLQIQRVA